MEINRHGLGATRRSGFSLVEMLVVTGVVVLLISLLLPALSGARDTALRTSTRALESDLTAAAQRFSNDNGGRLPGYFSQALMGHSNNLNVGMSAMENAMLELGGTGVVLARADDPNAPATNAESGIIEVGPSDQQSEQVVVNINLIGGEGAYFSPDSTFLVAQDHEEDGQFGTPSGDGQELMPDLVDSWSNPMLLWSQDEGARGSIVVPNGGTPEDVYTQFARITSDGPGDPGDMDGPAWFYLASNAAFIEAPSFGISGRNMSRESGLGPELLDGTPVTDIDRVQTLAAMLASPSSYQLDPGVESIDLADADMLFPARPRARFMVHSAGSDGIYLNRQGAGWSANAQSTFMDFGNTFKDQGGNRYREDDGSLTNIDLMEAFDDHLAGAK